MDGKGRFTDCLGVGQAEAQQLQFLKRQLSLPVPMMSQ
jgi:hypothetical protein